MASDANSDPRRVALLARPGQARDRLSALLEESGARCVIAADPTQLKPAALQELHPQVVLVVLDPMTEEVLEQFDAVLADPSVDVIYEEAEQAVAREGWDAARWQRHLVAKLQGHANVLPPGGEPAAERSVAAKAVPVASAVASAFDPVNAELDDVFASADPLAPDSLPELDLQVTAGSDAAPSLEASGDFDFDFSVTATTNEPPATTGDTAFDAFDDFAPLNFEAADVRPVALDRDAADTASGFHADLGIDLEIEVEVEQAAPTPPAELSLQDEALELRAVDTPASRDNFRHDLDDLQQRISTMALVDDTPRRGPEQAQRGAVLVLSGLGGPDAVRQLLGALPVDFARPVLVQQRLEGGRHDRLVTQLQRATKLPVALAAPAQVAAAGTVYILPDAMGATATDEGIRFSADPAEAVLAALASDDSAVLLLSGSDPGNVDAVMAHSLGGALVAGQAVEGCYDPAAANALAARGGEVAAPAELARRLCARWSTQGARHVQA